MCPLTRDLAFKFDGKTGYRILIHKFTALKTSPSPIFLNKEQLEYHYQGFHPLRRAEGAAISLPRRLRRTSPCELNQYAEIRRRSYVPSNS